MGKRYKISQHNLFYTFTLPALDTRIFIFIIPLEPYKKLRSYSSHQNYTFAIVLPVKVSANSRFLLQRRPTKCFCVCVCH